MKVKIALAQINSILGEPKKNIEKHFEFIERSIKNNAKVVVFPELSITGYLLKDLTYEVAMNKDDNFFNPLKEASRNIDIIIGFAEKGEDKVIYNSSMYLSKSEILSVYRKMFPPTHGMFDELRYFGKGKTLEVFQTDYGKVAVIICRDFFHPSILTVAYANGIDFLFAISNMPLRGVKGEKPQIQETVETASSVYTNFFGFFVTYVNRVGFDDGLGFYGGSFIQSPLGKKISSNKLFEEDLVIGEVDTEDIYKKRTIFPLVREEDFYAILKNMKTAIGGEDD